jgi:hypothetical protein
LVVIEDEEDRTDILYESKVELSRSRVMLRMYLYCSVESTLTAAQFRNRKAQVVLSFYKQLFHEWRTRWHNWHLVFRQYTDAPGGSTTSFEIEYALHVEPPTSEVQDVLCYYMSTVVMPANLQSLLSRSYRQSLFTVDRRVFDLDPPSKYAQPTATQAGSERVWMVKPDGEHTLVIDAGYLWLYCSFDTYLTTCGFKPKLNARDCRDVPDACCVEFLNDGRAVWLFPVFTNAILGSSSATMQLMQDIPGTFEELKLIVRAEYASAAEAYTDIHRRDYPCDGVIGKFQRSGLTYRVKTATVDLLYSNGELRCRDHKPAGLARTVNVAILKPERVYECHLSNVPKVGLVITDVSYRPDKRVPNTRQVLNNVICCHTDIGYSHEVYTDIVDQMIRQIYASTVQTLIVPSLSASQVLLLS